MWYIFLHLRICRNGIETQMMEIWRIPNLNRGFAMLDQTGLLSIPSVLQSGLLHLVITVIRVSEGNDKTYL